MTLYFVFLLLVIATFSLEIFGISAYRNLVAKLLIIGLVIVAATRFESGGDYFAYRQFFSNTTVLSGNSVDTQVEIGFIFLMRIFKIFCSDFSIFLGFVAAITLYFWHNGIKFFSSRPSVSLIIAFGTVYVAGIMGKVVPSVNTAKTSFQLSSTLS